MTLSCIFGETHHLGQGFELLGLATDGVEQPVVGAEVGVLQELVLRDRSDGV